MYARLLWALIGDARVPPGRKALLVVAGIYIISPFDLIPERVPLLGALDDVAVMVLAIDTFLEGLPPALVAEKLDELGIGRAELDSDLARVRRLVPKPIRAAAAALPEAIESIGRWIASYISPNNTATEEEPG